MATSASSDIGREFTAEVYRAAAQERTGSLQVLYDDRSYGLAMYVAGLAVEALFRACRCRIDPEFDSRHDLYELAKAARFRDVIGVIHLDRFGALLNEVAVRWSNNHRFRSDAAMRAFLKRGKLDRGMSGDFLKENARIQINAATELVAMGVARWKKS
jgi:hypothetical protein